MSFSRPTHYFWPLVNESREMLGPPPRTGHPVDADIVVPVQIPACPQLSATRLKSKIPFRMGLIRNHIIGPHVHRAVAGYS